MKTWYLSRMVKPFFKEPAKRSDDARFLVFDVNLHLIQYFAYAISECYGETAY